MINTAPCKDCKNREFGCHGKCERYKSWQIAHDAEKNRIYQIQQEERDFEDFKVASVKRAKEDRKNKRRQNR